MQIVRGKEQESEYIWQKYVEAVRSPRRMSSTPCHRTAM